VQIGGLVDQLHYKALPLLLPIGKPAEPFLRATGIWVGVRVDTGNAPNRKPSHWKGRSKCCVIV
jgi:hypothetical protein